MGVPLRRDQGRGRPPGAPVKHPVLHAPGQAPWKEWDLRGQKRGDTWTGWTETAYAGDLALVETVLAVDTRFPLETDRRGDRRPSGYDLVPVGYNELLEQHPNMPPRYGRVEVRPNIVRWQNRHGGCVAWGSHHEQSFRAALSGHPERPDVKDAEDRALRLLCEFLTPGQRLELMLTGSFLVNSKTIKDKRGDPLAYRVNYLNGVTIGRLIPGRRRDGSRGYWLRVHATACYHGQVWLPGYDVMLSTKLLLDNEEEFLREANVSLYKKPLTIEF